MRRIRSCFALALGLPLGALNTQEAAAPVAGARVRVLAPKHICTSPETWPCYHYVVGTLTSIDSASIVVRLENGETETVSRASATRLDVSAGRRACGARSIRLGFVGGAGVGTLVASEFAHNCRGDYCALNYLLILPAGAILGIVVGALVRVEHWETNPLLARLSVGRDGSGGFSFGLSVAF